MKKHRSVCDLNTLNKALSVITSIEQKEGDFEHKKVGVDVESVHDLAPQGGRDLFALQGLFLGVTIVGCVHSHPVNRNRAQ